MTTTRALVLGGGGLAGIAWETGLIAGLADGGVDLAGADLVIGTSAGSTVGAQLGSGLPIGELFRRQAEPAAQNLELVPGGAGGAEFLETMTELAGGPGDRAELRRRIGELALTTRTVPEAARRVVIESRLPVHDWPPHAFLVVAVVAETGEPRVFDRTSGVGLVDAVAASCAVPGVWPPMTIGGVRYVDGGVRSLANADLAAGHQRILVLLPFADPVTEVQIAALRATGSRVELLTPDEASLSAFGPDPLDPATRTPAAHAGREQGRRLAATVAALWQ